MSVEYSAIHIEKHNADTEHNQRVLEDLLSLSKAWADEKCGPSYAANNIDDFVDTDIYVALENGRIVAYAFGHIKTLEEATSYNKVGEKAFELDEIYVAKNYRNRGIGKKLYEFVELAVRDQADLLGLIATSYRYKDLLRFYIDELGMSFNHALLIKRM